MRAMNKRSLDVEQILSRLMVDTGTGKCFWVSPSKYHAERTGREAGGPVANQSGKKYWTISIDGSKYKRSQLVLTVASGTWPKETVDHINGDSLDDRASNLRHATVMQNAWNHKTRRKKTDLPMGVRSIASGKFQARIAFNHKMLHLGSFSTPAQAHATYLAKRKELYGDFA